MSEFERSLKKVLVHEGGFSDHPKDPGGATMKGVTQGTYDAWRRAEGLPVRSVRLMEEKELQAIYRKRYWDVIKGDKLPPGVSYVVFDGAVNSGPSQSVKWLQRALGIKADGMVGQDTIGAVSAHTNHDYLIAKVLERRLAFLKALKTWKTFKNGWTDRVDGVRRVGQAWAMGDVGPEINYVPGGDAKAYIVDAKVAPSTAPGDVSAGGGGIAAVLAQTQEQLTPYVEIGFVAKAVAVLTIGGAVLAVGGIAYRMWARRRASALADALDTVPA
jgi:lysozyme family protein